MCMKHGKLGILPGLRYGILPVRIPAILFFLYATFVFPGYVSEVAAGFSLEGHTGLFFGARSECVYWLFLDFFFQVTARALSVPKKYQSAPGPFAAEGRCFILGDWRSTWSAERQVCVLSVSPCLIIFPLFSVL